MLNPFTPTPMLITTQNTSALIQSLEEYMIRQEAFKSKRLSINEVALETRIPAKKLSGLINSHYQQRFTDWINTYRVNHVIDLLKTDIWMRFTLEGVATEAGFASRSAFFASFKKLTGCTASAYLKHHIDVEYAD